MLKSLVVISVAAVLPLMATSIESQPPCAADKLNVFIETGYACSVNGLTFSNFTWSPLGGVLVDASAVTVKPAFDGAMFGLEFTSDSFRVTGTDNLIYALDYRIDPPPPIIDRMSLRLRANSPIPPGTAEITVQLCAGALFSNSCRGGVGALLRVIDFGCTPEDVDCPGNSKFFDSLLFPTAVSLVDVRTTIELRTNCEVTPTEDCSGALSEITGFTNSNTTTTLDAAVPEANSYTLMGSGLAFILLCLLARGRFTRLSRR